MPNGTSINPSMAQEFYPEVVRYWMVDLRRTELSSLQSGQMNLSPLVHMFTLTSQTNSSLQDGSAFPTRLIVVIVFVIIFIFGISLLVICFIRYLRKRNTNVEERSRMLTTLSGKKYTVEEKNGTIMLY
ncbi:hypothetical protein AB6A40_008658 [Gnathostoma spinigerum]|uniref:Uncharacterized protein n=1 Tax=Gnathostoma spinigerum TaxID=75299 RepID=A0ABD6EXG8_9BILA